MDRVGGYHRKEAEQRRTLVASEASQAPLSVGTTRVARAVGERAVVVRLREEEIPWTLRSPCSASHAVPSDPVRLRAITTPSPASGPEAMT